MNNYVGSPTPSHNPPERSQTSRVIGGLTAAAAVTVAAVAFAGHTNQGQINRQVPSFDRGAQTLKTSRVLPQRPNDVLASISPATETDTAQALSATDGPAITAVPGQNEIRTVTISDTVGPPVNSGNFTMTFRSQTTSGVDVTLNDGPTILAALEALSNIDPGDVEVTTLSLSGDEQTKFTLEFKGQYARQDIATGDFTVNTGTMDDSSISVANTQQGATSWRTTTDVAQALSFTDGPSISVGITAATETDVAQALSLEAPNMPPGAIRAVGRKPHDYEQTLLPARIFTPPVVGADSFSVTPATETDAAQALSFTDGPSVSASITAATETDVAQALSFTDGPAISVSITAATEIDAAYPLTTLESAVPPPVILKPVQSHNPVERRRSSQVIAGLAIGPIAGAPPPTVQLQGGVSLGNTLGVTRQVPSFDRLNPKDQIPQAFVYLNAAPPIYNVIVPGTTNQGFKFYPVKQLVAPSTERGSRTFLRLTAGTDQSLGISPASETDVAQTLSVTDGPSISKTLTAAVETDGAQALGFTQGPSQSLGITPATETDVAQALGFTQQSITIGITSATETDVAQALSVTQDIVKTLTAALETDVAQALSYSVEGGGGARQRMLTGMGT